MVSVTSLRTLRAFPMTGVISALPANHHRLGGSLENLILKISSRVNDRRCLWGKLLSSMIRYRLNVTYMMQAQSSEALHQHIAFLAVHGDARDGLQRKMKEELPQEWSDFRNLTAKNMGKLDNPIKSYDFSKF